MAGRVNSAGAWTLGPTTASHQFQRNAAGGARVFFVQQQAVATGTANLEYILFQGSGNVNDGFIGNDGGGVFGAFNLSDVRRKENIRDLEYGLDVLLQTRPVRFDWIGGAADATGFIAQELVEVMPDAVFQPWLNEEDDTYVLSDKTFIPVLVKAIQELKAELDAAKARISTLEGV